MVMNCVSGFIFLASAYEGGWPVLSLAVLSSDRPCLISVFIIAELSRGHRWNRIWKVLPWRGFEHLASRLTVKHANYYTVERYQINSQLIPGLSYDSEFLGRSG